MHKFVRQSTGTVLGKIKAERDNPQADVWFGGTFEPHLQAADQGLLARYRPPLLKNIMPQFNTLMASKGDYTSIIYLMEIAIGVNTEKLKQLNIPEPKCFADLLKPAFKHQIQYADPRVSGTGCSLLTTLYSFGDKAFDYLQKLNANIAQYSKSGLATSNLAIDKIGVDIAFMHGYIREEEKGAPVKGILPCEGVAYTLGAVSIIKGGSNIENTKHFIDFVLDTEAQQIPWRESEAYQHPVNIYAQSSLKSSDLIKENLLDIDFIRFGSDAESKRLIQRWVEIIKGEK